MFIKAVQRRINRETGFGGEGDACGFCCTQLMPDDALGVACLGGCPAWCCDASCRKQAAPEHVRSCTVHFPTTCSRARARLADLARPIFARGRVLPARFAAVAWLGRRATRRRCRSRWRSSPRISPDGTMMWRPRVWPSRRSPSLRREGVCATGARYVRGQPPQCRRGSAWRARSGGGGRNTRCGFFANNPIEATFCRARPCRRRSALRSLCRRRRPHPRRSVRDPQPRLTSRSRRARRTR